MRYFLKILREIFNIKASCSSIIIVTNEICSQAGYPKKPTTLLVTKAVYIM